MPEWSRSAQGTCGDDKRELIKAFERVAEREKLDLARPLSDLEHLTAATDALWSQRLQSVFDHPLEERSNFKVSPRFDVPGKFLGKQDSAVALRYVDKLVAIGFNEDELVVNRTAAFNAAAYVIDGFSRDAKSKIYERMRSFMEQPVRISDLDQYQIRTQHPLSRSQINFGSDANVQGAAGWLLGRTATEPEECSFIVKVAVDWVCSDDPTLQHYGASILTLPNLSSNEMQSAELAKHKNPSVRCVGVNMAASQACPAAKVFEQLAS